MPNDDEVTSPTALSYALLLAATLWCEEHPDETKRLRERYSTMGNKFLLAAEAAWYEVNGR